MNEKLKLRASSLARLEACPASYWLSVDAPPAEEREDALRGTLLHQICLEGGDLSQLAPEDQEIAERVIDTLARLSDTPPDAAYTEAAFSIENDNALIPGHPDRIEIRGSHAIIPDLKFGFLEVPHASRNLQLGAYALMVAQRHPEVQTFEVVIIQPMVRGQGSRHVFDRGELAEMWFRIEDIGASIEMHEGDPRPNPSEEACRYCPALSICPAHRQSVERLAVIDTDAGRWDLVPTSDKLALWHRIKAAKKAIEAIEYLFRTDLEANPSAFGGEIYLTEGRTTRKVTEAAGLFQALSEACGMTGADFARCVTVRITDVTSTARKLSQKKGKAFEEWLAPILAPFIETATTRGSLETKRGSGPGRALPALPAADQVEQPLALVTAE